MSNREIAHRLGVTEKAIRKLVGPSKAGESAQLALPAITTNAGKPAASSVPSATPGGEDGDRAMESAQETVTAPEAVRSHPQSNARLERRPYVRAARSYQAIGARTHMVTPTDTRMKRPRITRGHVEDCSSQQSSSNWASWVRSAASASAHTRSNDRDPFRTSALVQKPRILCQARLTSLFLLHGFRFAALKNEPKRLVSRRSMIPLIKTPEVLQP